MTGFLIIAVAVVAVPLGWVLSKILELKRLEATAQAWPRVPGTILEGDVERVRDHSWDEPPAPLGVVLGDYRVRLVYEYTVAKETFRGDRVTLGGSARQSHRRACEMLDRYPVGARVAVYYDPARPDEGVLETHSPKIELMTWWFWGGLAVAVFLIGAAALG